MQLLKIASTPDEAYELCNKYAPDCENMTDKESSHIEEPINSETNSTRTHVYFNANSTDHLVIENINITDGKQT